MTGNRTRRGMPWRIGGIGSVSGARRLALGVAAAAISVASAAVTSAEPARTTITVRVYQSSGLPSGLEPRALAEAERILGAAFVDVRWRICGSVNPAGGCDVSPAPSELLLRVMPEAPARQDASATLGEAYVEYGERGVLATVYVNWVARLAGIAQANPGTLLGRVIAHELGHLIMRPSVHTRRGLMRRVWTYDEVRRNRAGDWTFTAADVAAMQQRPPGPPGP